MGSFRLGSLFGIAIQCSWSFVLLVLLLLALTNDPAQAALYLGLLFGAVLLHELGHALVARRFGIRVLDIALWPLGGMARMSEMPEKPKVEGCIAAAGPAVNLVLAAASGLVFLPTLLLPQSAPVDSIRSVLLQFLWINAALGTLNLLPAFPMDGGRILRAWLARTRDWVDATELAVRTGRWIAGGMVVVGLLSGNLGWALALLVIAGFVWITGTRELIVVRLRHGRFPFGGAPMGGAFATNGAGGGAAPREPQWSASESAPPEPASPRDAGARRPSIGAPELDLPRGGLSDADVEALERFHGRLRDSR